MDAGAEYDFEAADKSLRHYLRALWDREFKLHPCEKPLSQIRPFISELGIHLPRQYRSHQGQFVKDLYRAAAAHAAAHQAYSLTTFERKKLKPLQLAIIGLLEDARVELLAIKAMPGLRKLWLGFFDARRIQDTGSEGIGVDSLLLRLAHVLLDPSREDDNPWVMKGRRLFAEFQQQGSDMEKLRELAGHETWLVFGGSWGSTLALAYAETHPERVSELVLRGIFLGSQSEFDWLYTYGASELYPEAWQDFIGHIPAGERAELLEAYHRRLTSEDQAVRLAAAKVWSMWEGVTVTLLPDPAMMADFTADDHAVAVARIENHYFRHDCWLEPGQLLRDASRLKGIPGIIVQGRHDCCTPPAAAWALKHAWPEVELQIVPDGGHLFTEPGITDGLVRASDRFAGKA